MGSQRVGQDWATELNWCTFFLDNAIAQTTDYGMMYTYFLHALGNQKSCVTHFIAIFSKLLWSKPTISPRYACKMRYLHGFRLGQEALLSVITLTVVSQAQSSTSIYIISVFSSQCFHCVVSGFLSISSWALAMPMPELCQESTRVLYKSTQAATTRFSGWVV